MKLSSVMFSKPCILCTLYQVPGVVVEKRGGKWMQNVKVKHPGICTGKKYGSKSCPKGSSQYALATTFKKASKSK